MAIQSTSGDQKASNPFLPWDFMMMSWRLWEVPASLFTSWCTAFTGLAIPLTPTHLHTHIFHESHDQLVVPDAIEDEGEHALFA